MIKVSLFCKDNGTLVGFEIKGHAEHGEFGQDIVCSAVSSAAYMTANTITDVFNIDAAVSVSDCGYMYLKISEHDAVCCKDILLGFKIHMLNMEEQYPEDIFVNYLEV